MLVTKALMERTWRLPEGVPSGRADFFRKHRYRQLKWIFKFIKRRLFCLIAVEHFGLTRELQSIRDTDRNILWINWSAPSLGDSLMDLSCRVMLTERRVTLLTHPKNAELYSLDPYFAAVYSDPIALRAENRVSAFDLVVCDAFSPRVLIRKLLVAPGTPFVGLYGYLNGFEVHRTLYAFARMRNLLGLKSFDHPTRPTIFVAPEERQAVGFDVCIAVGGEWVFRTYEHWLKVIDALLKQGLTVCLVGSSNGSDMADRIRTQFPEVESTVGLLSLQNVIAQISVCLYFIGADGGLWHIASAIPIPTVVLFADCAIVDDSGLSVTRETADMVCETLYHEREVSQIPPEEILDAFARLQQRNV